MQLCLLKKRIALGVINNLFDTELKQSNSFSDYLISDSKIYILPRVVMFSIGYNL